MEEAPSEQPATGRWSLPTNSSALDSISRAQLDIQRIAQYQMISAVTSALCSLAMIFVLLFQLVRINKRLGVTVSAFVVSFPVGPTCCEVPECLVTPLCLLMAPEKHPLGGIPELPVLTESVV